MALQPLALTTHECTHRPVDTLSLLCAPHKTRKATLQHEICESAPVDDTNSAASLVYLHHHYPPLEAGIT